MRPGEEGMAKKTNPKSKLVRQILREAKAMAARLRAAGWTRQDFASALGKCLGIEDDKNGR